MAIGDLEAAIDELHAALPGWWFTTGECSVSCDATVAPDIAHCPQELCDRFDDGFHGDLRQPSTCADALRYAIEQAVAAMGALETHTPPPAGWLTIDTAPRDGTVIEITALEDDGTPFEIWPCMWSHIKRNEIFAPGMVGMWMLPDGSATWREGEGGPTHWRPKVSA